MITSFLLGIGLPRPTRGACQVAEAKHHTLTACEQPGRLMPIRWRSPSACFRVAPRARERNQRRTIEVLAAWRLENRPHLRHARTGCRACGSPKTGCLESSSRKQLSHPWCFGTLESSGHWRSTSVAVAQVSVGARQLESFTSCRRQAPTGRRANPTLVGGSDDEAARTGRCRARAPPSGRLGNWSSACQTTRCTQPIDPSGGSVRPGHWVH